MASGGFVGAGFAAKIAVPWERRFLKAGSRKHLTLLYAAGQGDGNDRRLNHFGHEGLDIRPGSVTDLKMVKYVMTYYWGVTRYTTGTFLRTKRGDALTKRRLAPSIYVSPEKARKVLMMQ